MSKLGPNVEPAAGVDALPAKRGSKQGLAVGGTGVVVGVRGRAPPWEQGATRT
ncbi:hypothetical protein [Sorangium sp. So ce341]|uniref:hypothetical protein n=1 Tax=Sorangium sp. So ce341 TaxID=3133302 RepID=UPI003F619F5B